MGWSEGREIHPHHTDSDMGPETGQEVAEQQAFLPAAGLLCPRGHTLGQQQRAAHARGSSVWVLEAADEEDGDGGREDDREEAERGKVA